MDYCSLCAYNTFGLFVFIQYSHYTIHMYIDPLSSIICMETYWSQRYVQCIMMILAGFWIVARIDECFQSEWKKSLYWDFVPSLECLTWHRLRSKENQILYLLVSFFQIRILIKLASEPILSFISRNNQCVGTNVYFLS